MKYIQLNTLFLVFVFHTAFGQKQTERHKDVINSETKGSITPHGPSTSVRTIWQDRKGNIWLASNEGIIRYDARLSRQTSGDSVGQGKSFTNVTGNLFPDRFFSVLEDKKGNFWFGNYGSGAYYYDGKSIRNFTTTHGLADNGVWCIYEDRTGTIWFGTNGGVSRFDARLSRQTSGDGVGQGISLPTEAVAPASRSGTEGRQAGFRNFTTKDGLPSNSICSILEDKTGKLWFGTSGNTCVYDGKTFNVFTNKDGKAFNNVWSIIEDKKGNIWLGGDDGLWRYDGSTFANFTGNSVRYVYEDKKGNIWTSGFNDNGKFALSRYDEKSLSDKKPTVTEITQSLNLFGILEANDGSIWFGAFDGVYRYDARLSRQTSGDEVGQGKTITNFKSKEGH